MLACGKLDFRWRTYVRNDGIIVVSDPLDWADKYRKHAVECMQLAKTSFDEEHGVAISAPGRALHQACRM